MKVNNSILLGIATLSFGGAITFVSTTAQASSWHSSAIPIPITWSLVCQSQLSSGGQDLSPLYPLFRREICSHH